MTLDPSRFDALTFECYGTLIDWRAGIGRAAAALASCAGADLERLIADRGAIEKEIEAGPFLPYDEVLRRSLSAAAARQGRAPTDAELDRFAASMAGWQPFPDTVPALRRLAGRFRLGILSNVRTEVLQASVALLETPFAVLVTAEEVRSYKPARAHFDEGLRRLELPKERVLHVAQSVFHDVVPARALGWTTAWIDREGEREAGPPPADAVLPDLASLADALGA
jgi:2-haloacid dehalogenase